MASISSHILNLGTGLPAEGLEVSLEWLSEDGLVTLVKKKTDSQGRVESFLGDQSLEVGVYQLYFSLKAYFKGQGLDCFYPKAIICFNVDDPLRHYHIPLLLNKFGYSTYLGC